MDAVPQPPAKKDDERTTIIAMMWVRAQDSIQIWEISFLGFSILTLLNSSLNLLEAFLFQQVKPHAYVDRARALFC